MGGMPEPINSSSSKRASSSDDDTSVAPTKSSSTPAVTCKDADMAPCVDYSGYYEPKSAAQTMKAETPSTPPTQRLDGLGWGELDRRMRTLTDKLTKSGPYSGREADQAALLALEAEWSRRKSFATPANAAPNDSTNHVATVSVADAGAVKLGTATAHADSKGTAGADASGGSISGSHGDAKGTVQAFHASADAGTQNVDGSTGFHVSAGANVADGEFTYGNAKDGSVTLGASWGIGFEGSWGITANGALCYRLGLGPVLVGACTGETPTAAPPSENAENGTGTRTP